MTEYRRNRICGGTYFFTVALAERSSDLLIERVADLREAVAGVRARFPFEIVAWVVLPEHIHAMWTLPPGDADFAMRWRLIKSAFTRSLPKGERRSASRIAKRERGIWQRRFWEHTIRDDADRVRHVDYIHFNPVKHGLVSDVRDWPFSTFHRYVKAGYYPEDWGGASAAAVTCTGDDGFR